MTLIDTHQHLFHPKRFRYPWTADYPALQGTFGLGEYRADLGSHQVEGTVFMEVDVDPAQAADEAAWACSLAEDPDSGILGVVASGRPESKGFTEYLREIAHPHLKGIRRVLHTQDDSLSQDPCFRQQVAQLPNFGLSFDLCVLARQLPLALELVKACPETSFILDHCGVPDIAGGERSEWETNIGYLAEQPNVVCKISGLPAYCPPGRVTPEVVKPYLDAVIQAFGWDRVLWGGDWPVCNLNGSLGLWIDVAQKAIADYPPQRHQQLFSTNARRVYRLAASS